MLVKEKLQKRAHHKKQDDGSIVCGDCLGKNEQQTQLPKPDQPLVCAFQRRFSNPYRVQCALTGIGAEGVISRAFANYDPCFIDICPNYQNWKKEDKARLIPV